MSTQTSAVTSCPAFQEKLNVAFPQCPNFGIDGNLSLLPFLYSPENRSGFDKMISPVPGKKRTALLTYRQVISDSEVTTKDDCSKTCTATTERGDMSQEYTIECGGYMVESKIDSAAWVDSCTSNFEIAADEILKLIGALDNKISKAIVTEVGGLIGAYADDVVVTGNALVIQTLKTGTTDINPLGWYDVDFAKMATYCNSAFIASGQTMYKYSRLMEAGCCSNQGLDLGQIMAQFGQAVTYDYHVQQTFGTNIALMLQRGAIQLLTMNMNNTSLTELSQLNVGAGAGTYYEGIINSPFSGLPYDLTLKYDCGVLHIILEGNVTAIGMPTDYFPVGNRHEGVTYANIIQVSNS